MRRFLSKLVKNMPRGLDKLAAEADKEVWGEVDCLICANCCKTMTPTYTAKDIRRIARHTGLTVSEFKKKWLHKEKSTGDWLNRSTPCQFLDLSTNKCSVYHIRPKDCSGYPHHNKKRMADYIHVHKQNIECCPATFRFVQRLEELVSRESSIVNSEW